jgi:hypothetical protein
MLVLNSYTGPLKTAILFRDNEFFLQFVYSILGSTVIIKGSERLKGALSPSFYFHTLYFSPYSLPNIR